MLNQILRLTLSAEQNIICAPKMRINFWCTFKKMISLLLSYLSFNFVCLKGKLIAFNSDNYRIRNKEKKQRTYTINKTQKIKSDKGHYNKLIAPKSFRFLGAPILFSSSLVILLSLQNFLHMKTVSPKSDLSLNWIQVEEIILFYWQLENMFYDFVKTTSLYIHINAFFGQKR